MGKRILLLAFMVFPIFLPAVTRADVIHLNDGQRHEGEIIEQNEKEVVLKTKYGTLAIPREDIKSIELTPTSKGGETPKKSGAEEFFTTADCEKAKTFLNDYAVMDELQDKAVFLAAWKEKYRGRTVRIEGKVISIDSRAVKVDTDEGLKTLTTLTVQVMYFDGELLKFEVKWRSAPEGLMKGVKVLLRASFADTDEPKTDCMNRFLASVEFVEVMFDVESGDVSAEYTAAFKKKIARLIKDGEVTPGTEVAVIAGLKWLARHQDKKEGNWDVDDYQKNCKGPGSPCSHMNSGQVPAGTFDAGVSGLALLAFLGHGQTHRVGKYKKTVDRGLKYLIKQQDRTTGRIGNTTGESWIYSHTLATTALCEAYSATRDATLRAPAQKAVDYIMQAQNPGYAWKYEPRDGKNDTSITGWMIQALAAARKAGLTIHKDSFDGAVAWIDRVTRVSDGKTGYMRPGDNGAKLAGRPPDTYKAMPTMTAVAILTRLNCGQKSSNKKILQGVKLLMAKVPDWNKPKCDKLNFYYWYYGTYAMRRVGGADWKTWNAAMKKALLKNQRAGRICQDGSWDPIGEWSVVGGRIYSTAINVLTLEAYYRCDKAKE